MTGEQIINTGRVQIGIRARQSLALQDALQHTRGMDLTQRSTGARR